MYEKYEKLLKKTGKTSYQVSKDTGIGQNTLSNWKTGRSKPKIEKIKILADYFGVKVEELITICQGQTYVKTEPGRDLTL